MQAAVIRQFGQPLSLETVSIPKIGHGDVLVRIHASGVCHTDLHVALGELPMPRAQPLPLIPGHEGTGVVAELGEGVSHLRKGERVGIAFLAESCGMCSYCTTGAETCCAEVKFKGYSVDGCYAEYVAINAKYVYKLPDQVSFEEAASLFCAGVTTFKAVSQTGVKAGQWLAVLGIGGLGHVAIQFAKAMGLKVLAVDVRESCLELATKVGADDVINAAVIEDVPGEVVRRLNGGAAGVVVTSTSPKSFTQAVQMLRKKGVAVFVGLPKDNGTPVDIIDLVLNEKVIKGVLVGTRDDMNQVLQFAADGKIKVEYSVAPFVKVNEIFDQLKKGAITGRVILKLH